MFKKKSFSKDSLLQRWKRNPFSKIYLKGRVTWAKEKREELRFLQAAARSPELSRTPTAGEETPVLSHPQQVLGWAAEECQIRYASIAGSSSSHCVAKSHFLSN